MVISRDKSYISIINLSSSDAVAIQLKSKDNLYDLRMYAGAAVDKPLGGFLRKRENVIQYRFKFRWHVLAGAKSNCLDWNLACLQKLNKIFESVPIGPKSLQKIFLRMLSAGDSGSDHACEG